MIKSKINLITKELSTKEAEKIISEFNKPKEEIVKSKPSSSKDESKSKKISKK